MITTVTLNAAIDKTYFLTQFDIGKVMRVENVHAFPGGKGINVARVVHLLGHRSLATGYIGGSNGDYIEKELDKQMISHHFLKVDGESRVNLNIIDNSNGSTTELLEPGPAITDEQIGLMIEHISKLAEKSRFVVFSGSIPRGAPLSIYAQLIEAAKAKNALVLLDTSGEALVQGVKALPYFIKPNLDEIQQILGKSISDDNQLYEGVLDFNKMGIPCVTVSLGKRGSITGYKGQVYVSKAPIIDAVNTVGCGDSFVAGMAVALSKGSAIDECLRYATAVGTANALTAEAGNIRLEDVLRLINLVGITRLN